MTMKKTMILAALVATLGTAYAQNSPTKAPKAPQKAPVKKAPVKTNCAVMPKDVIEVARSERDGLFSDYKGKRYYFCCPGCKPAFDKTPAKYVKNAKGFPIPAKAPAKKSPAKKPA